ncbi:MAG TPA: phosphatase PAP2 family protein [Xanthobacteraceae bacterium]|nr:phosphatase PAP2 family protein [Xanthobacteraceae bacterium]
MGKPAGLLWSRSFSHGVHLSIADRLIEIAMVIVLIIGGYQFYFWAQRQRWYEARFLETRFDSMISYDPRWVWVYSGLYYPMIVIAALSLPTWDEFAKATGCFLLLLAVQVCFFLYAPVEIPVHWRANARGPWEGTRSQRFIDVVWSYDKLRNSMPSMHVSVATMTDLTIWWNWPTIGHVGILFPILIAISALKTKQHYVVDVVPGAALGAFVFWVWHLMI